MSTELFTFTLGRTMFQLGYSQLGFGSNGSAVHGVVRKDITTKYRNFVMHTWFTTHFSFGVGRLPQQLEVLA